jgi:predicted DNA-binding WGR domain protein
MHIYMQAIDDAESVPRYYHLVLQEELLGGWSLLREWGVSGTRGRSKRDDFASRDEAERVLMACRDAQLNRGFRVVFVQGDEGSI